MECQDLFICGHQSNVQFIQIFLLSFVEKIKLKRNSFPIGLSAFHLDHNFRLILQIFLKLYGFFSNYCYFQNIAKIFFFTLWEAE